MKTAMTKHCIKAVGTVVGANLGQCYCDMNGDTDGVIKALEAIGQQQTAEARGTEALITNWIPKNQEEREKAGITDIDIRE
ncbi:hypothetical protein K7432_017036, partial [Basidiobolus ranarum]